MAANLEERPMTDPHDDARPGRRTRHIAHDQGGDAIDRRGFLRRIALARTGLLWMPRGAVPEAMATSAVDHANGGHPRTRRGRPPLGRHEIGLEHLAFRPRVLTVKAGASVTWINRDGVPHVVVNVQEKFPESPVLEAGDRYSYRFATPGRYEYFCSIHPRMTGTIVVQ
jgi:plastocyanin